jgi:hypothetical protein
MIMGAMAIGAVLGFILGATSGTQAGAFAGAIFGMSVGLFVYGFFWARARAGDMPTIERHQILCTPLGRIADCEVQGDLETRRWYDIKRCSLLRPATNVDCDKTCLKMINDSGTRPGSDCHCED